MASATNMVPNGRQTAFDCFTLFVNLKLTENGSSSALKRLIEFVVNDLSIVLIKDLS